MGAILCIDTASAAPAVGLQLDGALMLRELAAGAKEAAAPKEVPTPEGKTAPKEMPAPEEAAAPKQQKSGHILPLIDELLKEADTAVAGIKAIGITTGPGSFTGIRLGLGIAQGLAYPHGLPLVPVSSLALQAAHALAAGDKKDGGWVLVCQKAQVRGREIYAAAYTGGEDGGVTLIDRERVIEDASCDSRWVAALPSAPPLLCSDCPPLALELCIGLGREPAATLPFAPRPVESLARLARLGLQRGRVCDAAQLRPNYVKEEEAMGYRRT